MKKRKKIHRVKWILLMTMCLVMLGFMSRREKSFELKKEINEAHIESQQKVPEYSTVSVIENCLPQKAGDIINAAVLESEGVEHFFYSTDLSEEVLHRIQGVSYQENDKISVAELRYLRVLYYGFDGKTHIGELIVNQMIETDILQIMKELYENQYPIEKMVLIDEYGAEDEASMEDNNSSAFNYREILGSSKLSKHSLGLAIDINPKYNPCVRKNNGKVTVEPSNAMEYTDRTREFEHKITEKDLCCQLFTAYGFQWGGSWKSLKDYQHFEKK